MTHSDRKILFDNYFKSIFQDSNPLTSKQFNDACLRFDAEIGKFMPKNLNSKILDIGCGCGNFLYYLKTKGYKNFYGIDVSSQQIEYCRNHITDRIEEAEVFEYLHDKNDFYDLIALNAVLEHIPKTQTINLLKQIHVSLKSNGSVLIQVPNMSNIFASDLRYKDFTHEAGFTEMSLKQVLKIAKFNDILFTSSQVIGLSFKNRIHRVLVNNVQKFLRILYYIQGYSVPKNMGKILIAIAKK